ncbi:DUF3754 domain-containing protein [Roseospira visakhapatnamensis]|uniref:DUF3754 domain-containing protein n=1 Tax=Roseospira visakhapatnamensis TaxID=390880 RepID=A0A7W6RD25_9PROT|nr:DUF3754 domain-containing protein [Roseospira visakhapatnamensis]MBB4266334.1 hypothetical protein [Roseospira visakhapatnamensis]
MAETADDAPSTLMETAPLDGMAETDADVLPDTFIAVPQSALIDRLVIHGSGGPDGSSRTAVMRDIFRMLGLLFRIDGSETLVGLRDDYHPINPDLPTLAGSAGADSHAATHAALAARLRRVLIQANFTVVTDDRLRQADEESAEVQARIRVPRRYYADVAFFARGRRRCQATRRYLFGLITRQRPMIRLRHVVVMIRFHERLPLPDWPLPRRVLRAWGPGPVVRPFAGKTVIKLFTDVAEADLNMLYPGARAVMRTRDKLMLGVPAVAGGVPIMLNILPALSVLAVVLATWMGFAAAGSVDKAALTKALAAMSALAGLGGFLMRQIIKVERQVLKYQMALTETLYVRNVCNNAAVFDYLIGTAEDQEFKEAALAYVLLDRAARPLDAAGLKVAVEDWVRRTFAMAVDFDITDALDKLARLDLVTRHADNTLTVPAPDEALDRLRARWHAEARDSAHAMAALGPSGAGETAGMDAANGR